ncbi:MAG: sulfur oxidation c-type cytochrome SoxX [Gammaproteobacteria bacterium]|nr:sulfur oxidation c-type cytochrome SoxX [Gammaproteobacteria bacterium]
MRKTAQSFLAASSVAIILGALSLSPVQVVAEEGMIAKGKSIAEDRKKGNCFTCHHYEGAHLAGNIGPPFIAMKERFPDKAVLRAQIWDSTTSNPKTMMPPFGRHEVLSEDEIDAITEWVYSL